MKLSKSATEKTLAIVAEVMDKYKDRLYITVPLDRDPDSGMSVKDMLLEFQAEAPEKKKKEIQLALDTGVYDRTEEIIDESIAYLIDKEIDEKILECVEKKELPKLSATFLKKKTRKYVRKLKKDSVTS
jgi:hypothetical protein